MIRRPIAATLLALVTGCAPAAQQQAGEAVATRAPVRCDPSAVSRATAPAPHGAAAEALFTQAQELLDCAQSASPPGPAWKLLAQSRSEYNLARQLRDDRQTRKLYGFEVLLNALIADDPKAAYSGAQDLARRRFFDYCSQAFGGAGRGEFEEFCPHYLTQIKTSPAVVWRGLGGAETPQPLRPACAPGVESLTDDDAAGSGITAGGTPDSAASADATATPALWTARAKRLYALSGEFAACAETAHPKVPPYLLRVRAVSSYDTADANQRFLNNRNDDEEAFKTDAGIANDTKAPASLRAAHKAAFLSRCIGTQRYFPEVEQQRCADDLTKMQTNSSDVLHVLVDETDQGLP